MFFDPGLTDVLRNIMPGLGDLFLIITEFGSELVFIGVLLTLYWAVNKKEAILATYLLVFALLSNYWLKIIIAKERPPVSNWYPGADAPNYSTPSGHSQSSASLYGWFTIRVRKWWMAVIAVTITVLVGISRIYLGVHYLGDVLLGWGIGIITVIAFVYLENPMRQFFSRFKQEYILMSLVIIGFVMTLIAYLLPQPPNDNFGAVGGLTMGLALGLVLENRFVGFSVEVQEGERLKLVLRVIIGFVLVFGVMLGLAPILPTEEIWLRALRYMLIALTGVFVWPAIFKRMNL
ncbi:MAG: phosphatase PAP2 family protein [Candidatus Thorarchaeota archaeon]|nr:phosphatase PAP2 family protein [Candidatus Thorarchaeota archaeon]